jgi:hypothetical protein
MFGRQFGHFAMSAEVVVCSVQFPNPTHPSASNLPGILPALRATFGPACWLIGAFGGTTGSRAGVKPAAPHELKVMRHPKILGEGPQR